MCEYASLKKKIESININSSCVTLTEFIAKNSVYSFGWPCFYDDLIDDEPKITEINSAIETKIANLDPFLNIQDYFDKFDNESDLFELITRNYSTLPMKVLKSNVAKVSKLNYKNFFFQIKNSQNSKGKLSIQIRLYNH